MSPIGEGQILNQIQHELNSHSHSHLIEEDFKSWLSIIINTEFNNESELKGVFGNDVQRKGRRIFIFEEDYYILETKVNFKQGIITCKKLVEK